MTDPVLAPPFAEQIRGLLDMFDFEQVHRAIRALHRTLYHPPGDPDGALEPIYPEVWSVAELKEHAAETLWMAATAPEPTTVWGIISATKDAAGWLSLTWSAVEMDLHEGLFTADGRCNGDPPPAERERPHWGERVS